jgi:hypothetical protein
VREGGAGVVIVVRIEMWPKGNEERRRELGRTYIYNAGGSAARGDYEVRVCRKRKFETNVENLRAGKGFTRTARIEGYPRLAYNVWRLVLRALREAFPEEK